MQGVWVDEYHPPAISRFFVPTVFGERDFEAPRYLPRG